MSSLITLEEQPFQNYIYSFDYTLRDRLVKIAIISYEYERQLIGYNGNTTNPCYPISAIRYLVLDEDERFLYSSENLSNEENDNIQEHFCMLQDNHNYEDRDSANFYETTW